jgi:carboxyl-terminal processing protease
VSKEFAMAVARTRWTEDIPFAVLDGPAERSAGATLEVDMAGLRLFRRLLGKARLVLSGTIVVLACGTTNTAGYHSAAEGSTTRARVLRIVLYAAEQHADLVEPVPLLMRGVGALDAEAGVSPPSVPAFIDEALAAFDRSVQRLRDRDPTISDAHLVQVAATAILASLGDQSRYYSSDELQRLSTSFPSGQPKGGVGLTVQRGDPYPTIVRVLPDSPAAENELASGEELRAIDGQTTTGLRLDELVQKLQGPVGSATQLAVGRPGKSSRTVLATRRTIPLDSTECRVVDGRVLYLGIRGALSPRVSEQVRAFGEADEHVPQKVILDLRGNGGGLFDSAVSLADLFLDSGEIVTVARWKTLEHRLAKKGSSRLENAQVVVLVDGATASGAEVIAAALQDAGRARVVGDHTEGLADIRLVYSLKAGDGMSLVVAHMLRPRGERISGNGITPDVLLATVQPEALATLPDLPCAGLKSVTKVGADPAVVLAARLLSAP